MERQKKITTVLAMTLLYTAIISIFTLLQNIKTTFFFQGIINNKVFWFFQQNTLWIVVIAAIIFGLNLCIRKSNQKMGTIMANNPIVYLTTGLLVVLDGISSLASSLPHNILSVMSVMKTTQDIDVSLNGNAERMILQTVITNALSIVIILCQIILGLCLIKTYKKRMK